MKLDVSRQAGYVLATVGGLIDESSGELFSEHLHPLVGEPGAKLVLDLSGVKRVNSAGLSYLVVLASKANTNSGRVVLAACSPFLSVVLERSKLDQFFEIAETVPEAVQRALSEGR
jgi:anti-anti-sigma factor